MSLESSQDHIVGQQVFEKDLSGFAVQNALLESKAPDSGFRHLGCAPCAIEIQSNEVANTVSALAFCIWALGSPQGSKYPNRKNLSPA